MSPHLAEDFAAEMASTRLSIRQEPLARGHHGNTETTLDTGKLTSSLVYAVTGTRDPLDTFDHGLPTSSIAKDQLQLTAMALLGDFVPIDEPLIDEDLGNTHLQLRRRHRYAFVAYRNRVADTSQHVRDRISNNCHQDAFLTPGSSPREASSRTQMRHMPKSRM
jgi:hypothetical protein